jgi:hypothetical protein
VLKSLQFFVSPGFAGLLLVGLGLGLGDGEDGGGAGSDVVRVSRMRAGLSGTYRPSAVAPEAL